MHAENGWGPTQRKQLTFVKKNISISLIPKYSQIVHFFFLTKWIKNMNLIEVAHVHGFIDEQMKKGGIIIRTTFITIGEEE